MSDVPVSYFARLFCKGGAPCHPTLLQRILAVQYSFPANRPLSPSCQDLIARMLVPSECGW